MRSPWLRGRTSVKGQSTTGLTITGNTTYSEPVGNDASTIKIIDCEDVKIGGNRYLPRPGMTKE